MGIEPSTSEKVAVCRTTVLSSHYYWYIVFIPFYILSYYIDPLLSTVEPSTSFTGRDHLDLYSAQYHISSASLMYHVQGFLLLYML